MNPGLLNHLSPLVDIRLQPRLNLFRCACLDLDSKFEKSLFYVRSAGSPTVLDWSIHDLRQRAGESKQSIPEKPATPPSRKIRISGVLCELTDLRAMRKLARYGRFTGPPHKSHVDPDQSTTLQPALLKNLKRHDRARSNHAHPTNPSRRLSLKGHRSAGRHMVGRRRWLSICGRSAQRG